MEYQQYCQMLLIGGVISRVCKYNVDNNIKGIVAILSVIFR